ncbi:hypothetical protein TWF481_004848 [Arthrobotrys musiformis]|uniref:Uncharacterized protein n=1 Tax=Arthrobotrys musiformis TaxID=47236 RepID=A0AAV9WLX0_9PEZI
MDAPDERTPMQKYYDDEKLFKEIIRRERMGLPPNPSLSYLDPPEAVALSQSGDPSNPSSKASLSPYGAGNVSTPNIRLSRPCDDLLESLRNGEDQFPHRRRRARDKPVVRDSSTTKPTPSSQETYATQKEETLTTKKEEMSTVKKEEMSTMKKEELPAMKKESPPKTSIPNPEGPKVRYRGVSDDPRSSSSGGVPDWYNDAHKELRAKHPYDYCNFVEGYRFYAEGPSSVANDGQDQYQANSENSYLDPLQRPATPMPHIQRSQTPLPLIAPLNHPAVDSRILPFTPPTYGRYRYRDAVSANTWSIDETINKFRHFEMTEAEKRAILTSGSDYVDRIRKSVKYMPASQNYPSELLDMYNEEPSATCPPCEEGEPIKPEQSTKIEKSIETEEPTKPEIPEIRVQEAEASTSQGQEDLYTVHVREPNKLTVPRVNERESQISMIYDHPDEDLYTIFAREQLRMTALLGGGQVASNSVPKVSKTGSDSRSVSDKSDNSAKGYAGFFDYYSRASGPSVAHEAESVGHASALNTADENKRSSVHTEKLEPHALHSPLVEEQGPAHDQIYATEYNEEPKSYVRSRPLQAIEEEASTITAIQETHSITPVEVEINVQDANTDDETKQYVPMKPRPAYVEHAPDKFSTNRRSICDGTNFWRDDFSAENGIKDRVIVEKPATIEKPTDTTIPPKHRVPKPASIVGSDSPPHEIKDTNSARRPTIVQVEPTSPTPPPVPPKEPITPELGPTPPPKSPRVVYHPTTPSNAPTSHPSMADIGRSMRIDDDDVYSNMSQKENFNTTPQHKVPSKAMKVLGVGADEIRETSSFEGGHFVPFLPYGGSKLEREVNHATDRNNKLDQDPSKSSKSLLGLRGSVSSLFRKRDKPVGPSKLNTDIPRIGDRASVEILSSSPDSPRPGLFKRLFNKRQSDAPSTAPSIESYGGSRKDHESWDSSRASGDTSLTSNNDTFTPYIPPQNILDSGRPSTSNNASPADYIDHRINPNLTVKLNDKPLKSKRSFFFGREKNEEPELMVPGVHVPVPREEKQRASVFGFLQKEKSQSVYDDSTLVDDIKKKIVEEAEFERSDEYVQMKKKEFADKQKAKIIQGQKGYFNRKGEYFRAKNPLELELCDSEISEPQSFSEVKEKYENEKPVPAKEPESGGYSRNMPRYPPHPNFERKAEDVVAEPESVSGDYAIPTPIVEEPETLASEPTGISHESITVMSPVQPGFTPENEPPSHWSDDSDEEEHDASQPPTPSNPSFGRSGKSHKRTGSGSSNLGTGPMFMKKAVRKFKANRKSAEVRASLSLATKGNRDSVMSQASNGSNRNAPPSSPVPPSPAPPVPARGSTDAGVGSGVRTSRIPVPKVSVTSPPSASRLTTGTYHDQKDNVVHHFGGTIPERSGSSLGHRGDRTSMPPNLPERSKSSLGHNVEDENHMREGIRCTADVTPQDIYKWVNLNAKREKEELEKEKRKQRIHEAKIKEAEEKIKRAKKAAKADSWMASQKKKQDDTIEKSKFRVNLATKLAGKLVQRETNNLKKPEQAAGSQPGDTQETETPQPENEPTRGLVLNEPRPYVDLRDGTIEFPLKHSNEKATFGCGPNDPPLQKLVPLPTEPVELWKVPKWVMDTKGPEWVYQWQNQGIYPENPWYPSAVDRSNDGIFEGPLFKLLLQLGDLDGAMYFTHSQLLMEIGDHRELPPEKTTEIMQLARERLHFFKKFFKSIEAMHERQQVARQHSEKLGQGYFDPLEDLDNEDDRNKELKYATERTAARRTKLQKILGGKPLPEAVMDDEVVKRDILLQRHFERQVEQNKMVEFKKQIQSWTDVEGRNADYLDEELERQKHQRKRAHKDLMVVGLRDYLGLHLVPQWLDYGDLDSDVDPLEVREVGMSEAEKNAKKRNVIEFGEDVEANLQRIDDEEDLENNFWFETELIYRKHMAEHLGISVMELVFMIHDRLVRTKEEDKPEFQKWDTMFDPAGPEWVNQLPNMFNFNVYESEALVMECKKHYVAVQKVEQQCEEYMGIAKSKESETFILESTASRINVLRREWRIKKELILEMGINQWREQYGGPEDKAKAKADKENSRFEEQMRAHLAKVREIELKRAEGALQTGEAQSEIPVEAPLRRRVQASKRELQIEASMQALREIAKPVEHEQWEETPRQGVLAAVSEQDYSPEQTHQVPPGRADILHKGMEESSTLLGTSSSKQRRKVRPTRPDVNTRSRPYGSKPRSKPSKPHSKQQSKQRSKQQSKTRDQNPDPLEHAKPEEFVPFPRITTKAEKEALRRRKEALKNSDEFRIIQQPIWDHSHAVIPKTEEEEIVKRRKQALRNEVYGSIQPTQWASSTENVSETRKEEASRRRKQELKERSEPTQPVKWTPSPALIAKVEREEAQKRQKEARQRNTGQPEQTQPAKWTPSSQPLAQSEREGAMKGQKQAQEQRTQAHKQTQPTQAGNRLSQSSTLGRHNIVATGRKGRPVELSPSLHQWSEFDGAHCSKDPSRHSQDRASQLSGLMREIQKDAEEDEARDLAELEKIMRLGASKIPGIVVRGPEKPT